MMPPSLSPFRSFAPIGARFGRAAQPRYAPEEEEAILRRLARGTMSGLATVAHVLDTPGSFVRGMLAGEPGRAFSGILNPQERVYGRELLQNWDMLGPNRKGFDWGDVAGFGADVVTDPLFYLSLGGGALTKAGKIGQMAGLMKSAPAAVAAKEAGVLGTARQVPWALRRMAGEAAGYIGPRQARMTGRLGDLLEYAGLPGSASRQAAEEAAETAAAKLGVRIADVAEQPLGGLFGVGLPFATPSWVATGPVAQHAGRAMDVLGRGVRFSAPGRAAARLFQPSSQNMATKAGQQMGQLHAGRMREATAQARGDIGRWVGELSKAHSLDPGESLVLRELFEGVRSATPHADVQPVLQEVADRLGVMIQEYKARGMPLTDLAGRESYVKYFPAYLARRPYGGKSGRILSAADPSQIGREDIYMNVPGGRAALIRFVKDPDLVKAIDSRATDAEVLAAVQKAAAKHGIPDEWTETLMQHGKVVGQEKHAAGRHAKLAQALSAMPSEVRMAGVWGNHPLFDLQVRLMNAEEATTAADTVFDGIAAHARAPSEAAFQPNMTRVRDVLRDLHLTLGEDATQAGALHQISRRLGISEPLAQRLGEKTLRDIGDYFIPKDIADDMVRFYAGHTSGKAAEAILPVVDGLTNLWKTSVTTPWPAFSVRNLVSGLWRSFVHGSFSARGAFDANALIRGDLIKGAEKIPAVQRILSKRGLQETSENGTAILRELAYAHDITSHRVGEAMTRVGAGEVAESSWKAMQHRVPGEQPFTWGAAGRHLAGASDTTWNPAGWRVQGVGEAAETTMPVVRAGEDLNFWVESINRLTPWITDLRKGFSPAKAAQRVRQAQVEYTGRLAFTPFERQFMRRAMPFYSFSSRQIPFVLRQLWEHPGGRMAQTIRAIASARDPNAALPPHISQGAAIPLPPGPTGDPRYLAGIGLMMEDPMAFATPSAKQALLEVGSRMHPIPKALAEWATGQSFFQVGPAGGRPLEDMDPTWGRLLANVLGRQEPVPTPPILEHVAANAPAIGRLGPTLRTITDPRKAIEGTRIPGPAVMANVLTGLRVADVSEGTQDALLREQANQLLRLVPGAFEFSRVSLPEDARQRLSPSTRQYADDVMAGLAILAERSKKRKKAKQYRWQ